MADEEKLDEDLDLGEEQEGGSKKKLIIIIGAAVLVLLLGGGAAWFFMSGDDGGDATADTEQTEGKEADKEKEEAEKGPANYHSLNPVFVVNLPPGSGAKMMQIGVDVMTRNAELMDFMKINDPMIRHKLLDLFGTQDAKALRKRAGKEKLQAEVLDTLQKLIKEQAGPGKIEAVYFTSFVMQ